MLFNVLLLTACVNEEVNKEAGDKINLETSDQPSQEKLNIKSKQEAEPDTTRSYLVDNPLSLILEQLYEKGVGVISLEKSVNINKEFETAGLKIKLLDAKVHTISPIQKEYQDIIGLNDDKITYFQLRYDLENTTDQTIIFKGLETAIPNNGKPIDIMSKDLYYQQNPTSTEIAPKTSVNRNIIGIAVEKDINSIRLVPSDVMYDDENHSIFSPEEILIEFKKE